MGVGVFEGVLAARLDLYTQRGLGAVGKESTEKEQQGGRNLCQAHIHMSSSGSEVWKEALNQVYGLLGHQNILGAFVLK